MPSTIPIVFVVDDDVSVRESLESLIRCSGWQVGRELGISVITVKAHRGKVMRQMAAHSLAELVTMAARLRLAPVSSRGQPGPSRGGAGQMEVWT